MENLISDDETLRQTDMIRAKVQVNKPEEIKQAFELIDSYYDKA